MEYKFTFIDIDGKEDVCVCSGTNLMDCLFAFYSLHGTRNILLVVRS